MSEGKDRESIITMMRTTWRVMYAVMLRDLRTRFFNHGLGYLVTIAFPLVHIVIIITTYSFFGRSAPFGRDAPLFFATGFAPFMAWMYMSRYIMLSGRHSAGSISWTRCT